jgi:prophage regulatory protein
MAKAGGFWRNSNNLALLNDARPCLNFTREGAKRRSKPRTFNMTSDTPDCFLRLSTVLKRTGLSRSTLYRKIELGTFPRQVKIAERCAAWRQSAVDAWMRNPIYYSAADE